MSGPVGVTHAYRIDGKLVHVVEKSGCRELYINDVNYTWIIRVGFVKSAFATFPDLHFYKKTGQYAHHGHVKKTSGKE